ncbi:MAG: N-6 DNA methylase [Firmicutes bacterium]|nr:N-6 DNA methylase [Bacillota bacterium]
MYSLEGTLWQDLQKWRKILKGQLSSSQINTFLCGYLIKKTWRDKGYVAADALPPVVFSIPGDSDLLWKDWKELCNRVKPLIGDNHGECSLAPVPMEEIISFYLQLQSPHRRQRLGSYYTPPPLVDFILEHTLAPRLNGVDPRQVTFLDPACGCGYFLTRAYDQLKTAYLEQGFTQAEVPSLILQNNIFGIDIDPWALQLAALLLLEKGRGVWQSLGKLPTLKLFWGDALDKSGSLSSHFNRAFSVVAGNPPHVTNYARCSQGLEQEYIDALKPQYLFSRERSSNRYNLTMFFLERFLELLETGGRAGIVVDGSGFQTTVYKEIREHIQAQSLVRHIVAGLEVFPGVNNRQAILILEQSSGGKRTRSHRICYRKGLSGEVLRIPQDSPTRTWLRPVSTEVASLLAKIEAAGTPLGELFQPVSGMNVTNRPGAGLKPFLAGELLDSSYHKAIFSGNISPYILRWPTREQSQCRGRKRKYICYDRELARAVNHYLTSRGLKARVSIGKSEGRFRQEKLFVRQSLGGSRNIAAAYSDDPEEYCDNSVYVINACTPQYPLFYLLPILNSSLMTFYARESGILSAASRATATRLPMGTSRGRGLRDFPIPVVSPDKQKPLIELASRLIFLGRQLVKAESRGEPDTAAVIQKRMKLLQERVEEGVFSLYGLNRREVDLLCRDGYGK